ncbi:hypothetical protein DTO282F9_7038 [Paecilomyces variotii]|nr:hypothetical protein DTO282F9_7038 [Paecilomyces variotii]
MVRHMATANPELRRIMPILGSTARTDLRHEGNVFGARFMYWQLKQIWTEDRSRAQTATAGPSNQPGILTQRIIIKEALH